MCFEASFSRTVSVTIFVSGTFDLSDVTYKQRHWTVLNPFLNGTKTATLMVRVNKALPYIICTIHEPYLKFIVIDLNEHFYHVIMGPNE